MLAEKAPLPDHVKDRWHLSFPPHPLLLQPGVVIRDTRPPNLVDAYVPVPMLRTHDLPVDEAQMRLLDEDFKLMIRLGHENGQRDPIGAAILEEQSIEHGIEIHDGYHRGNLLARNGAARANVSIAVNCAPDELLRLRTLAATPHEMVKPPRMVLTLTKQWELTDWAQRGIGLTQAFQLVVNAHNTTGARHFESPGDAAEAAEYLRAAIKGWGVPEPTAYQYFLTAAVADPAIFFRIEGRRNGRELKALTFQHVQAIARTEYGKRSFAHRFEEQRLVQAAVLEHSLNVSGTQFLMRVVVGAPDPETVRRIIEAGKWLEDYRALETPAERRAKTKALTGNLEAIQAQNTDLAEQVDKLTGQNSSLLNQLNAARAEKSELTVQVGRLHEAASKLAGDKNQLEHAVAKLTRQLAEAQSHSNGHSSNGVEWWTMDIPGLSPLEKTAARLYFGELLDEEEVGTAMGGIPGHQAVRYAKSGRARYKLHLSRTHSPDRQLFADAPAKRGRPSNQDTFERSLLS